MVVTFRILSGLFFLSKMPGGVGGEENQVRPTAQINTQQLLSSKLRNTHTHLYSFALIFVSKKCQENGSQDAGGVGGEEEEVRRGGNQAKEKAGGDEGEEQAQPREAGKTLSPAGHVTACIDFVVCF